MVQHVRISLAWILDTLYGQLAADPMQDFHFFQLMKSNDPGRIRQLVQFATEHLPLQSKLREGKGL